MSTKNKLRKMFSGREGHLHIKKKTKAKVIKGTFYCCKTFMVLNFAQGWIQDVSREPEGWLVLWGCRSNEACHKMFQFEN